MVESQELKFTLETAADDAYEHVAMIPQPDVCRLLPDRVFTDTLIRNFYIPRNPRLLPTPVCLK